MAILDASITQGAVGPLKEKRVVDISVNDFEDERGFVVQAGAAGDLTYRSLIGNADLTDTLVAGGSVNVGGVLVLCRLVKANATIGSIVIGFL